MHFLKDYKCHHIIGFSKSDSYILIVFKPFSNRYYITVIIIRYKLLKKAKPGRKKKTTKALLLQPDAPELNQEAEDEDYYNLEAESLETNVPSISIETELQAHIFDDENNNENDNLFNNNIYNNDQIESLHSRLINDLRSADPDNDEM